MNTEPTLTRATDDDFTRQSSGSPPIGKPRGKPSEDGRFIWIASIVCERIINNLGATQSAFGIAVYVALCRLSSKEKNSPVITANVQKIAGAARLSYSKTKYMLDALERDCGVIEIQSGERHEGDVTQKPNTFILLSFGRRSNKQPARRSINESADGTELNVSCTEIPKDSPVRERVKNKGSASLAGFGPSGQPAAGGRNNTIPGQPAFFKRGLDD